MENYLGIKVLLSVDEQIMVLKKCVALMVFSGLFCGETVFIFFAILKCSELPMPPQYCDPL